MEITNSNFLLRKYDDTAKYHPFILSTREFIPTASDQADQRECVEILNSFEDQLLN